MRSTLAKSLLASVAGVSLTLSAGLASASTVTECKAQLATLQSQTSAAEFTGRNAAKDEAGLLAKLQEASSKLDRAKLADAAQKVFDYAEKIGALCAQGKIAPDSSPSCAELEAGADAALACIAAIQ